jgi:clan AA aspartic protease (TIGR02281 family)
MMWPLQEMEADCIDRSICMRLTALHVVALLLLALAGRANAQAPDSAATDPGQLASRWQVADTTCRSQTATAVAAVGACEQRDTLSKLLSQMNYCFVPAGKAGPATWTACGGNQAAMPNARTTAQFHRMGGVFVLPAVINGSTKSYFIVDSGAANVQIPEEVADEMKRAGTLADSDFLGQRRFTLADGSGLQQRVFRLKSLQLGDRTMENVLAAVGPPRSRALLGQSFLRRLSWWKIDNVKNAMEFEFTGSF